MSKLSLINRLIRKLPKKHESTEACPLDEQEKGYNTAIEDILEILKEEQEDL